MKLDKICGLICQTAAKYKGIEEIPENKGWKDKDFELAMKKIGWKKGYNWCALFAKLVWKIAYETYADNEGLNVDERIKIKNIIKLFSANSQATFRNFKKGGYTPDKTASVGAIVVWKYDKIHGHTAIVTKVVDETGFECIEGNVKNRVRKGKYKTSNKKLMGFIKPIGI